MDVKKAVLTHHIRGYYHPNNCQYLGFQLTSDGKFIFDYEKRERLIPYQGRKLYRRRIAYDLSNMKPGVTYKHAEHTEEKIIEGVHIDGDTLHIDLHDVYVEDGHRLFEIEELSKTPKGVNFWHDNESYYNWSNAAEIHKTIVFPPVETHTEWVDRMERLIANAAQNYEAAMGSIHTQDYTRLHDALTAKPSTDYLVRQTNTSVHCRWQIGWLWERVNRIKRKLSTSYTKAMIEAQVLAMYANMQTPQHIKQFLHRHNTQEWSKLRNQSESTGENKRHISLWDTDYTEGTNLADLTARSTFSGVVDERTADASMFEYGVTEYTKAAKHPNWELITERIY